MMWDVELDQNFHFIKRANQKPINLRVQYTNLHLYWCTVY